MATVIFDMDGVLYLSRQAHAESYAQACLAFELPVPDYSALAGMRTDEAFAKLFRDAGRVVSAAHVRDAVRGKRALAREKLLRNPPVDPEAYPVISGLASRHLLGLASSSSAENVDAFLEASRLREFFEVVVSGDDVQKGKPHPEIYIHACQRLGVNAEETWAIEDSLSGVRSARSAGLRVIGRVGESSSSDLLCQGAERVILRLSDLEGADFGRHD